ncbi:MAG: hypothetical protein MZW92_44975 [Comamonadaceae bacterium]|nr:hypothetical protein [Comamonadaceae bacterium]
MDISDWLVTKKGALVIPTIITGLPAVDYGIGAVAIFFHSSYTEKGSPQHVRRDGCCNIERELRAAERLSCRLPEAGTDPAYAVLRQNPCANLGFADQEISKFWKMNR